MVTIGIVRIVSTYTVFNQTTDEPYHIARGIEWWKSGTYTVGQQHPPLAPISIGLVPYLISLKSKEENDQLKISHDIFSAREDCMKLLSAILAKDDNETIDAHERLKAIRLKLGNDSLYSNGKYLKNLTLYRVGVIPFFLLSIFFVWVCSRRLFGANAGVLSIILFTTLPPILAHSGLATTDIAIAATFFCAIFSFMLWLEKPNLCRSFLLGFTTGLALLSKFSSLLFLPLCALFIIGIKLLASKKNEYLAKSYKNEWIKMAVFSMLIAFVFVWAGYRFSTGPLLALEMRPHEIVDRFVGVNGMLHNTAYTILESPIFPLTEFLNGIMTVKFHEGIGHPSYFFGDVRWTGWWYFFPVALAIKTPIPFLVLLIVGSVMIFYRNRHFEKWQQLVPLACAIVILLVCMKSTLNLGVRHILPIYPFFAIIAGFGAVHLWNVKRNQILCRSVLVVLIAWQLASSISAHPEYLTYFNELANRNPEKIMIGSDLDWGQDLNRLSNLLKKLDVDEVSISYAGTADLKQHNLPSFKALEPGKRTSGWIAISLSRLKIWNGNEQPFSWLEEYEPVAMAGRSIKVYHIPEAVNNNK